MQEVSFLIFAVSGKMPWIEVHITPLSIVHCSSFYSACILMMLLSHCFFNICFTGNLPCKNWCRPDDKKIHWKHKISLKNFFGIIYPSLVGIWQSLHSFAFYSLYYFLFVVNRQWKVNNRHVTVGTGMIHHLSNGFLRGHWLVDASTVANWSGYFNKPTANIPYIILQIWQKWNAFKRFVPCSNWCELDCWI